MLQEFPNITIEEPYNGASIIYRLHKIYQSGYCLWAVTSLSGNGTHTLFRCLFNSLSSASRILVDSSFSTTEIPRVNISTYPLTVVS